MMLPVQIHFHGLAPSEAVEAVVRDKVARLERVCGRLMRCRVVIDLAQKHRHQGRPIGVGIELTLAGRERVVARVAHEDVYVALRDAFDAMQRQLEDTLRQQRDQARRAGQGEHKPG